MLTKGRLKDPDEKEDMKWVSRENRATHFLFGSRECGLQSSDLLKGGKTFVLGRYLQILIGIPCLFREL